MTLQYTLATIPSGKWRHQGIPAVLPHLFPLVIKVISSVVPLAVFVVVVVEEEK